MTTNMTPEQEQAIHAQDVVDTLQLMVDVCKRLSPSVCSPICSQGDYYTVTPQEIIEFSTMLRSKDAEEIASLKAQLIEAQKAPEVTQQMIDAYLATNTHYWEETDKLNTSFVRTGTVKEATRLSLQAALAKSKLRAKDASEIESLKKQVAILRDDAGRWQWLAGDCDGNGQDDFTHLFVGAVADKKYWDELIDYIRAQPVESDLDQATRLNG